MIETALLNQGWDDGTDWETLAARAVARAIALSPHAALAEAEAEIEVAIRLTEDAEVHALNRDYRGKDYATNVLSFGHELPDFMLDALDERPLGDLAICAPVVAREAAEQGKPAADHWAHMVIHGVLHLLGHDHEDDAEAETMDALERTLLKELGIADPYQEKPLDHE